MLHPPRRSRSIQSVGVLFQRTNAPDNPPPRSAMICVRDIPSEIPEEAAPSGTVLLRRSVTADYVIYIESGRVTIGVFGRGTDPEDVERQLGAVEGPCWLDVPAAILNVPSAFDAITQTDVRLRRLPIGEFRAWLGGCAPGVQSMMMDLARANRHQTELSLIRLVKDAQARCAEWLLVHATVNTEGHHTVHLNLYKKDLAAELGIVPETLSRILQNLRELRLIDGRGRIVTLCDPVGLEAVADLDVSV